MKEMTLFDKPLKRADLQELSVQSSSKGNQQKWYNPGAQEFIKGPFIYQGVVWRDWMTELLVCHLVKQLQCPVNVLEQKHVVLQDYDGSILNCVCSKDFTLEGAQYVSFNRILRSINLEYPADAFIGRQFEFIVDTVKEECNLDIADYLLNMLLLDILAGNEDRHLNNFGVLTKNGAFAVAPLFDFGLGLFEHDKKYSMCTHLVQAIELMTSKPFNPNPLANLNWLKRNHSSFLQKLLPQKFCVNKNDFPNSLGKQYFEFVCRELGVGVDYD